MLDEFDIFDGEDVFDGYSHFDPAVIGADGRSMVRNARAMPYAAVCYVERSFGGRRVGCSGTLIAPDLVLTAGHCIVKSGGRTLKTINVQPGRNGSYRAEKIPADRVYVARGFVTRRNPLFDYAVIRLRRPVRQRSHIVPLHRPTFRELSRLKKGGRLQVAGYPSDKPRGTMWTHSERLVKFDRRRLYHEVDTCPGHSGSAVLANVGGRTRVIGIHVAGVRDPKTGRSYGCVPGSTGSPSGGLNRAVRVSSRVMAAFAGGRGLGDYGLMRVWPKGG